MTRRTFLTSVPAAGLLPTLTKATMTETPQTPSTTLHAEFPSQDPKRVREFVGVCHGNAARVREMLKESPNFALATTDWGFGDWETALGAASHVGNREIAALLIENGARPDHFYHAMMGHLDTLKAIVAAQPGIQRILGPHGITLLDHARFGGDPAKETLAFLESLGDADQGAMSLPVSEKEKEIYAGRYMYGSESRGVLVVTISRQGDLWFKSGETGIPRGLLRVEPHGFAAAGNRHVRIRFKVEGDKAVSVGVYDPGLVVEAVRA